MVPVRLGEPPGVDQRGGRRVVAGPALERVVGELARGEHPFIAIRRGRVPDPELARITRARAFQYTEVAAVARLEVEASRRARILARELHPESVNQPPPSQSPGRRTRR